MNYSLTYTGVIVLILGWLYQQAGTPFSPEEAKGTIEFIINLVGVIGVLYGRFRAGGINIFGKKV